MSEFILAAIYCFSCGNPFEGEYHCDEKEEQGYLTCSQCHWITRDVDYILEIQQVAFDELFR